MACVSEAKLYGRPPGLSRRGSSPGAVSVRLKGVRDVVDPGGRAVLGQDLDDVEPAGGFARPVERQPQLGGAEDPGPLAGIDRVRRTAASQARAGLDLDEDQDAAILRHEIDL